MSDTRAQMLAEGVPWRNAPIANDPKFGDGPAPSPAGGALAPETPAQPRQKIPPRLGQYIFIRAEAGISAPRGVRNTRDKPVAGGLDVATGSGVFAGYEVVEVGEKNVQLIRTSDNGGILWGPKHLIIPIADFHHAECISLDHLD